MRTQKLFVALATATVIAGCGAGSADDGAAASSSPSAARSDGTVRIATYNASLNRSREGELVADLGTRDNRQAQVIAEIVQRNNPDVLLINEFDYYADNAAADLFRSNYLRVGQKGQHPVDYPYAWAPPVNTGVPSGRDLNGDGTTDGPDDAYGFGQFSGQYGLLVLSKFPIDTQAIRTFQNFLWKDQPGSMLPRDYYGANADALRLSSKTHADVPVTIDGQRIHLWVSHPTPPSFDGPEDRNGRRNHDEIRLSADYLAGGDRASYLYDDRGERGGLPAGEPFVLLGDQNSDPEDGDSVPGAMQQVLDLTQDPKPTSEGAEQAGAGSNHRTPSRYDTADFSKPTPGNLRVDYVLPSKGLTVAGTGVFWPAAGQPGAELMPPRTSSDHRLVWLDLTTS
ncbi:Endonuclease/exonuclease/phosphatase OS=Tsukamurella paurometabola (strain ATCC 8368 / DSM /CCUG 35730 / CIP 100753 / JCM 10117 / KCTC 9821 / NBRC 16120/ NCIMB 702349 / NCTC 13040) OX=521096 GN=Tpau_2941 PE=4 SV=1 [Tsukamurella paurometabola]|uniref:Endonuclease/exonuclease/phosphatase n=1 Tax=Tsukamurella paurometabola (strain ATCC 8368 / DSM 20162 / CCUG 35730 / CIP 100753 / JCM 10117 / KCTC 9821 / NBRC 16120 / NCIMB 702349 / NCTC 13040) TaxID=521096 RepID=D5UU36_TSUPD|nr:endonuclease/exonuclease/phosphatase family protein [Tsukamurella paurometabola]ADG79539.1 Endonuclease/exonuclease/phosphatase [Tsukamurella paurometabola DSM 20162]SUP36144.1 3-phytase (myo-inositol-hexaphosphate 3-phosphohydrolase) [Tsukamurella paurometabola]